MKGRFEFETFTTGDLGWIFEVSNRVVAGWIDSGKILGSYKVNGDRRVLRRGVIEFIDRHDEIVRSHWRARLAELDEHRDTLRSRRATRRKDIEGWKKRTQKQGNDA